MEVLLQFCRLMLLLVFHCIAEGDCFSVCSIPKSFCNDWSSPVGVYFNPGKAFSTDCCIAGEYRSHEAWRPISRERGKVYVCSHANIVKEDLDSSKCETPAPTDEKVHINTYRPTSPLLCYVRSVELISSGYNGASLQDENPQIFSVVLDHQKRLAFTEGQSVGILPDLHSFQNGETASSKRLVKRCSMGAFSKVMDQRIRIYSIASGRHGDDNSGSTFTLCIKRHVYKDSRTGICDATKDGLCSNYLCTRKPGDAVRVTGPMGKALLLPREREPLVMLATGTGVAPFRSHLAYLRRLPLPQRANRLVLLFLGARSPACLPYLKEWEALKAENEFQNFEVHFVWSRHSAESTNTKKKYVQDVVWQEKEKVWDVLANQNGHIYICGVKGMLKGIEIVLERMKDEDNMSGSSFVQVLKQERRWHAEVYE